MVQINWRGIAAFSMCLMMWAGIAEGSFRLTHAGRPGLRHALYAHATDIIMKVIRKV